MPYVRDDYCGHRVCIDPFYCRHMDSCQHSVHGTGHIKECQHSQRYYDFRHNPSDQDTRSYNTTEGFCFSLHQISNDETKDTLSCKASDQEYQCILDCDQCVLIFKNLNIVVNAYELEVLRIGSG